jgi:serine/threonine protein kinase
VQLASVVSYLHRHELLHLDLKPSNIVVEAQRVKLLDLSIARAPGKGKKGLGTRQYLAPEQARGARFTPATDVWGIGAVLYEAATGLRPFRAYEDEDRYEQLERRADGVRQHRKLHKGFAALIDSCLEPEPEQRPHVEALTEGLMRFAT